MGKYEDRTGAPVTLAESITLKISEALRLVPASEEDGVKERLQGLIWSHKDSEVACNWALMALSLGVKTSRVCEDLQKYGPFGLSELALKLMADQTALVDDWKKKYAAAPVAASYAKSEVSYNGKSELAKESTYSAVLRFRDGTEVDVPVPGDGWHAKEREVYEWPYRFTHSIYEVANDEFQVKLKGWDIISPIITHEQGIMILVEYRKRINAEQAQLLETTRWEKSAKPEPPKKAEKKPIFLEELTREVADCRCQVLELANYPKETKPLTRESFRELYEEISKIGKPVDKPPSQGWTFHTGDPVRCSSEEFEKSYKEKYGDIYWASARDSVGDWVRATAKK